MYVIILTSLIPRKPFGFSRAWSNEETNRLTQDPIHQLPK
jgi:hypothetical protein